MATDDQRPYRLYAHIGSPYSMKMRALLRYRRIPYRFVIADSAEAQALPGRPLPLWPYVVLPGPDGEPGDRFGYSVNAIGDVDADTIPDIVVGARVFSAGESGEGAAFVYLGPAPVKVPSLGGAALLLLLALLLTGGAAALPPPRRARTRVRVRRDRR